MRWVGKDSDGEAQREGERDEGRRSANGAQETEDRRRRQRTGDRAEDRRQRQRTGDYAKPRARGALVAVDVRGVLRAGGRRQGGPEAERARGREGQRQRGPEAERTRGWSAPVT
jgi:hypothetical protein